MTPTKTHLTVAFLLLAALTTPIFAHAGHAHSYMGTVTMLHGDHAFMIKTVDGKELTIQTSPATTWADAAGHAVKPDALAVGERVVVKMNVDGKTAASVKMAPATK